MIKNSNILVNIISFLKLEGIFLLLFSLIIVFSQFLLLSPQLEAGFAPDDVRAISYYKDLGNNPLSKFLKVWYDTGPHYANQTVYNGILFSFLGFDYRAYHLIALIFKIFSIISFYLLVQVAFGKRLLSFLSALILSMHYGSVNSLEMVLKTQDYLVITGLNIFFILFYFYINKNTKNLFWLFLSGVVLFLSFFVQPIRAFPILPFILFIEIIIFLKNISLSNFYKQALDLLILFSPFLLLIIVHSPVAGESMTNPSIIVSKVLEGNWQLLLTPITTFGSLFLYGEDLRFLNFPTWNNFSAYISYLLWKPLFFFGFLTLFLSFVISKRPKNFFISVFISNFILEILLFFVVGRALNLPAEIKIHYDPLIFTPPVILGIYVIVLTLFALKERIQSDQKNNYLTIYLIGMLFSATFIIFHWFFQDYVFIPVGIRGYSTIPTLGVSAATGGIFLLSYYKLKNKFKQISSLVFLLLIPLLLMSNNHIQDFLQHNLRTGMRAADQIDMREQFWTQITNLDQPCYKLFYFSTKDDYPNGIFYSYIFLDNFYAWYKLYNPVRYDGFCPLGVIVNDEDKLLSSYYSTNGERGFLQKGVGEQFTSPTEDLYKYKLEDFYAFNLKNRKIIDMKSEILNKIGE